MGNRDFSPRRRAVLTALGGVALTSGLGFPVFGQPAGTLSLRASPRQVRLKPGLPESPVWTLDAGQAGPLLRFRKDEQLQLTLSNELPALTSLNWIGFDGAQAVEPLAGQRPVPADGRATTALALRQAGTFLVDARLMGDGMERPSSALGLVVQETGAAIADRDEVMLIEEWRVNADGRAVAAGIDPAGAAAIYTVNGLPNIDLKLKPNERLRLRIINGCSRAVIGLKVENHDLRVIAIDSQPADPFVARGGQLVLAPGSRIDALIDATQPPGSASAITLHDGTAAYPVAQVMTTNDAPIRSAPLAAAALSPSHLPAQLDLKSAMRVELQLDAKAPWATPAAFDMAAGPVFQSKRGRVVVMAVTNPTAAPMVFHLHGHHVRLLDRLDDGWKPFWLDTLLLNARQTQRIAFLAEYPGNWLIEAVATNWAAPKLVRFYSVT